MERSSRFWAVITISSLMALECQLGTPPCLAGIILAPLQAISPPQADEDFPDSQFGSPPIRSDSNQEASRNSGNRRPAGLEFTDQTGQVVSNPIIQAEGTPTSIANSNPKPSSSLRSGVQEVALIAGDLGFFPKTIFATRDIPVRLFVTGASRKPLCVMMDFFQIRRQIRSQRIEEISFTPTAAGQFRFYCPINGMEGTLLVKEISTIARPLGDNSTPGTVLGKTGEP